MVIAIGAVLKAGRAEQRMGCLIARHDMGDELRARHLFPDQDQGRLGQSQAVAIRRDVDGNLPHRRGANCDPIEPQATAGFGAVEDDENLAAVIAHPPGKPVAVFAQGRRVGITGKFTGVRMDLPSKEQQFIVLRRRAQRYRSAAFGFGALQD